LSLKLVKTFYFYKIKIVINFSL